MRIILDVENRGDCLKALKLALEQERSPVKTGFGYWSSDDPEFSAWVQSTKTGVSVKARRKIKE